MYTAFTQFFFFFFSKNPNAANNLVYADKEKWGKIIPEMLWNKEILKAGHYLPYCPLYISALKQKMSSKNTEKLTVE